MRRFKLKSAGSCDECTDKYNCLLYVNYTFLNMRFFFYVTVFHLSLLPACCWCLTCIMFAPGMYDVTELWSLRADCLWRWSPAHSSKWVQCGRRWISSSTCSYVFINEASWVCGHAACGLNIVWGCDGINTVSVFWRGKQSHVSLFMLRCQV